MSRRTRYEVHCDWTSCPRVMVASTWDESRKPGNVAVDTVILALHEGWGREGGLDYCPDHLNAARDQAQAARRGEW